MVIEILLILFSGIGAFALIVSILKMLISQNPKDDKKYLAVGISGLLLLTGSIYPTYVQDKNNNLAILGQVADRLNTSQEEVIFNDEYNFLNSFNSLRRVVHDGKEYLVEVKDYKVTKLVEDE